jgi:hypothetical protein
LERGTLGRRRVVIIRLQRVHEFPVVPIHPLKDIHTCSHHRSNSGVTTTRPIISRYQGRYLRLVCVPTTTKFPSDEPSATLVCRNTHTLAGTARPGKHIYISPPLRRRCCHRSRSAHSGSLRRTAGRSVSSAMGSWVGG